MKYQLPRVADKRLTRLVTSLVAEVSNRPRWPMMTTTLLGTLSFRSNVSVTSLVERIMLSRIRRGSPLASSAPSSSVSVTRTRSTSSLSLSPPQAHPTDGNRSLVIGRTFSVCQITARFPLAELTASGNARPSTRPVLTGNGNRSPVNSGR